MAGHNNTDGHSVEERSKTTSVVVVCRHGWTIISSFHAKDNVQSTGAEPMFVHIRWPNNGKYNIFVVVTTTHPSLDPDDNAVAGQQL